MQSDKSINEVRKLILESNYLLTLIDAYRNDELTEREKEHLWVGLQDLAYKLANRHYGERQRIAPRNKWYIPRDTPQEEKQAIRVEYIYQFIRDYKEGTPSSGILYALHRRFSRLEMLVEFKFAGIAIDEDKPMPTRTQLRKLSDALLGCKLYREIQARENRIPTFRELLVAYAIKRIEDGKLVGWNDLKRFTSRVIPYFIIKGSRYPLPFDDELFNESLYTDMF